MKKTVLIILVAIVFYCVSCAYEPVELVPIESSVTTPVATPTPTLTPIPELTRTPKPVIPTDENGYILTCSDYDLNNDGQKDFFGFREDTVYYEHLQTTLSAMMLDFYNGEELNSIEIWNSSTFKQSADLLSPLAIVNEFAVGDYDNDGFPEIVVRGEHEDGFHLMIGIYNLLGDYKDCNFLEGRRGNFYSREGYLYNIIESPNAFTIFSDYDAMSPTGSKSKFAGMFDKSELNDTPIENDRIYPIDHFETIVYPDGDALLCRQPLGNIGYMWYTLKWDSKSTKVYESETDNCFAVEEWFQPTNAPRDKYRGYKAIEGYPYGFFPTLFNWMRMPEFNDFTNKENRSFALGLKETFLMLTQFDFDKREDIELGQFEWNVEELIWGMGADVNRDKLREMLVVGKDTNGKGKLGVVTALAKKPQLYTLEFDTQSIETAEIVPYKDMYIINCLVKDTSTGKQEWQAYKFDSGKFVGLTQKDVEDNHPAKLFRERNK